MHAALGNGQQMHALAQYLLPDSPWWSPDFEGHSGGIPSNPFQISEMAKFIHGFIAAHEMEKPVVFGYSLGGYVGAYLAIHYPDLLGGLITWGTRWDWSPEFAIAETKKLDKEILSQQAPAFIDQLAQKFGNPGWEDVLTNTIEMMHSLGANPPISSPDWKEIQCPVLILRGEKDKMVGRLESESVAKEIPNGSYEEVSGESHFLERVNLSLIKEKLEGWHPL